MKFRCNFLLSAAIICSSIGSQSFAKLEEYVVDQTHSKIGFEIDHLVILSVDGLFKSFDGSFFFDPDQLSATSAKAFKVSMSINATSIDTGVDKRDTHLRSPDFFDVKKFPKVLFVSKKVESSSKNTLKIIGDITIKGKTKPITFEAKFKGKAVAYEKQRVGFEATAMIDRKDYGLTWNDVVEAGPVVGDKVKITLKIQGIRKSDM